MEFKPPIPILRVFDHVLAKKFYVDWLGFTLDWEHQFDGSGPRYMQVSRGGAVVHLSEHFGDCTPGARIIINLSDADAFHRELHSRPNPNMNPGICTTPWNSRQVEVVDPFGNRITFDQPLEAKP
ncbi:MAG: glyoxalase superfamily protein [Candidatus Hydrogenedentota bacterium]